MCRFKKRLIHKSGFGFNDTKDKIGNSIPTCELEDFLGFGFQTFRNYCLEFVKSYNDNAYPRCISAVNIIIQFFDDVSDLFESNTVEVTFFIRTFESTNFSSILFRSLEDYTSVLFQTSVSFFGILSSLHTEFVEWMLHFSEFFFCLPHVFLSTPDELVCGNILILFHNILPTVLQTEKSAFSDFEEVSSFIHKAHEITESPILISEIIFLLSKFSSHICDTSQVLVAHISRTLTLQTLRLSVCSLAFLVINDGSVLDSVIDIIPIINKFRVSTCDSEYFCSYFSFLRAVVSKCDTTKKRIVLQSLDFTNMKTLFHSEDSLLACSVFSFGCSCIPELFDFIGQIFDDISEFVYLLVNRIKISSFKEKENLVSLLSDIIPYFYGMDVVFDDDFLEEIIEMSSFAECNLLSKVLKLLIHAQQSRTDLSYSIFTSTEFLPFIEDLTNSENDEISILAHHLLDDLSLNYR